MKIAIIGAESTGKTQLAQELTAHLQASDSPARMVNEFLREWCEREQRTPLVSEQGGIAQEQARRISGRVHAADLTELDREIGSGAKALALQQGGRKHEAHDGDGGRVQGPRVVQ